nr:disheveled-associated activator of morphogenesis 1-like [Aedes albopictus]
MTSHIQAHNNRTIVAPFVFDHSSLQQVLLVLREPPHQQRPGLPHRHARNRIPHHHRSNSLIDHDFAATRLQLVSWDDDPPEIYVLEGDFCLQPLTPTQPMPAFDELDSKFAELVEELDLSAPNKAVMLNLPPQKKWQLYCSSKSLSGAMDPSEAPLPSISLPPSPEHYIERLKDMAVQLKASSPDESPSNENSLDIESHTALFDDLKTALRTSAHSFVIRFIELQGFPALLEILKALDIRVANSPLHTSLIGCIKALMNNSVASQSAHSSASVDDKDTVRCLRVAQTTVQSKTLKRYPVIDRLSLISFAQSASQKAVTKSASSRPV